MSKLSKSVLGKIKKCHIKPKPRWQFVALRVLFWVLFIISVFLGSMATGIIMSQLAGVEWGFVHFVGGNKAIGFLMVLPYIWLVFFGLTLFLAHKSFEKTKKGYRHKSITVIGLILVLSVILGVVSHQVRAAHGFEDMLRTHVGTYDKWEDYREGMWMNPENGIIVGEIIEIDSDTTFILNAITGEIWAVDTAEAVFKGCNDPEIGMGAFVTGESVEKGDFDADQVKLIGGDHHRSPFGGKFERKCGE